MGGERRRLAGRGRGQQQREGSGERRECGRRRARRRPRRRRRRQQRRVRRRRQQRRVRRVRRRRRQRVRRVRRRRRQRRVRRRRREERRRWRAECRPHGRLGGNESLVQWDNEHPQERMRRKQYEASASRSTDASATRRRPSRGGFEARAFSCTRGTRSELAAHALGLADAVTGARRALDGRAIPRAGGAAPRGGLRRRGAAPLRRIARRRRPRARDARRPADRPRARRRRVRCAGGGRGLHCGRRRRRDAHARGPRRAFRRAAAGDRPDRVARARLPHGRRSARADRRSCVCRVGRARGGAPDAGRPALRRRAAGRARPRARRGRRARLPSRVAARRRPSLRRRGGGRQWRGAREWIVPATTAWRACRRRAAAAAAGDGRTLVVFRTAQPWTRSSGTGATSPVPPLRWAGARSRCGAAARTRRGERFLRRAVRARRGRPRATSRGSAQRRWSSPGVADAAEDDHILGESVHARRGAPRPVPPSDWRRAQRRRARARSRTCAEPASRGAGHAA